MAKLENLVELLDRSLKQHGPQPIFGTKTEGRWDWITYAEFGQLVARFRGGLASLGVQRGDRVALISNNRVEWAVSAYACFSMGVAVVPMYEAQLPSEWAFIINDCEAVAAIVATPQIYGKCKDLPEKAPSLKHLVCLFEPAGPADGVPGARTTSYRELLAAGEESPAPAIQPTSKDTACLIYTSGTTGNPKGVILSHGNIASNVCAVVDLIPFGGGDRSLSFLPWAHSFGHTGELHVMITVGASMALSESVDKIVANLAEVHPTVLMSVPRIFNRIYEGVQKQMTEKPAVIQGLFRAGLRAATKQNKGEPLHLVERLTLAVADRVIFSKIRAKFGGKLKYAISGGAALSYQVAEFVDALGITIYEGYGLTETSPVATVNYPGARRLGSVGKAIPGVRVVIDKSEAHDPKQGEIVIYGPNVMMGYYKRDVENKAVFTEDGGFRTGDLGYLDDDGYLYVTGRIKEQYKLENGKYVAPAPLEEKIKLSPLINSAMIYGDNRPFNVALIVPEMAALTEWARGQGLTFEAPDAMLKHPRVVAHVQEEVDRYAADFKSFERIKKIALAAEDFTADNGMLTPTLKLKRRVALEKHGPALEALFSGASKAEPREAAPAG
ncbi:AMP-dependent synthetase/ligase [Sorangium cellulosum]|uniref:Long-chain fatty acid--CoA ligase n=1 Tax=Sorangium cellulosum So0157-2 TaxID=1254432 RepID=S4XHP4_SORCE|nr:long-chain fatty acid--CoA ligase [Sorangium cellulosum]AGP32657.1 long-chain fatty acid--CoA ligase [Sorangium cellulosum So0157-2]